MQIEPTATPDAQCAACRAWASPHGLPSPRPLLTSIPEGAKQDVVPHILKWYAAAGTMIADSRVFMFDDKASNVAPFAASPYNARQMLAAPPSKERSGKKKRERRRDPTGYDI